MSDLDLIQEYISTKSDKLAYQIVDKYRKFVFSIALRYSGSYDDADDIAQEAFIKIFENISKFQGRSSFKTWIYRITVNTFLASKKKRSISNTLQQVEIDDIENMVKANSSTPQEELEFKELNERFIKALNSLPKQQREVFSLRYFDEMKYEEISQLLGLTVGGLKANYYHAIKKLTKLLK